MLLSVLDNQPGPARDIVMLNAGVALYAANVADSIADGIGRADAVLKDGSAKARLNQWVAYTQQAV
jgi:anthranilate phosphoribosyltransferase